MDEQTEMETKVVDPGWNDPPIFSYETNEAHSRQAKKQSLNKRIVFPISNAETPPKSELNTFVPGSTPPSSTGFCGLSRSLPKSTTTSNVTPEVATPSEDDKCESIVNVPTLEDTLRLFHECLQSVYKENNKESLDIQKRLTIMEKLWNDDKFSVEVKDKVYRISLALKEDHFEEGDSLQRSLMVDHSNVCSNWMAAIRKLLYRKKELNTT